MSFFYCSADHRDLHSFPTRRSSDLLVAAARVAVRGACRPGRGLRIRRAIGAVPRTALRRITFARRGTADCRSEEHTSELQSLTNLVCRLLLEKKKQQTNEHTNQH